IDRPAFVAGSMGQTGELIAPLGERSIDDMIDVFAEQASGLAAGGADIIWIETMSAVNELEAAVTGARRGAPDLPIVATMSFDTAGRSMMGVTGAELAELGVRLELLGFGANCGATVAQTEAAIGELLANADGRFVVAKANSGIPEWKDGGLSYNGSPEVMAAYAVRMRDAGVTFIGACCGSTPEHLALMRQAIDGAIEVEDIPAPGPAPVERDAVGAAPRRRRRRDS
ncbi:MAG: homocysteine S-methyltransferase family protein, partial [Acidimicrobiales bacterium]